jgi:hypothetical protein
VFAHKDTNYFYYQNNSPEKECFFIGTAIIRLILYCPDRRLFRKMMHLCRADRRFLYTINSAVCQVSGLVCLFFKNRVANFRIFAEKKIDSTNSVIENNLLIDFIMNPGKRIYRHLLLLLFFELLLLSNIPFPHDTETVEIVFTSGMILLCAGINFNLYVLVPRLFFKNRYGQYFLSVLFTMTVSFVFIVFILVKVEAFYPEIQDEGLNPGNILQGVLSFAFLFRTLTAASTAIKLFQR